MDLAVDKPHAYWVMMMYCTWQCVLQMSDRQARLVQGFFPYIYEFFLLVANL